MSSFFDFYAMQEAAKTLIEASAIQEVKHVFIEAMERDLIFSNMPLINLRLSEADIEIINLPNSYRATIPLEVDVVAFDLSQFKKAASLRGTILRQVLDVFRSSTNRIFYPDLDTSSVQSRITFGAGVIEGGKGHVASATFTVVAEADIEGI